MEVFNLISYSLVIACLVQATCQLFKFIYYSAREGKLNVKWLASAGGMPSAHSAFVSALSTAVGLKNGFASEHFAIAFVFSVIVVHDSFRVRGAIEEHSRALEKIASLFPERDIFNNSVRVGHTFTEMLVGVIYGAALAILLHLIFRMFFKLS